MYLVIPASALAKCKRKGSNGEVISKRVMTTPAVINCGSVAGCRSLVEYFIFVPFKLCRELLLKMESPFTP